MVRLTAADDAHAELARQQDALALASARDKLEQSTTRLQHAEASLAPLRQRSGANTNSELADAIDRSGQLRQLRRAAAGAEQAIREGGDGLPLEQLRAEAEGIDMAALIGELDELTGQDAQLVERLSDLAPSSARPPTRRSA